MTERPRAEAGASGRFGTDVDGLRSFGRQLAGHGGALAGLGVGEVVAGAVLPGSATARALAVAAEACDGALARVHTDYAFAGEESVGDSTRFEEHEHGHAAGFRALGDRIGGA